ncbi:MAG: choice-of-anchor Q domain-containing protein, partial [Chloroflexota bacterium]
LLGPLQDNGGPTFTHALLEGSPAIETGNPAGCVDDQGHLLTVDQRGYVRPIDADADGAAICDVGAFEYGSTFQPDFSLAVTPVAAGICLPGQATYQIDVTPLLGFSQAVGLSASGQPVGVTTSFDPNPVTPPGSSALTLTAAPSAPSGRYDLALTGQTITRTHTITAALELFGGPSEPPALLTPADGAIDQPLRPTFTWSAAGEPPSVVTYDLEIATDSSFNNIILAAPGLVEAIYTPTADLQREALYYWRVRASNSCGSGGYSTVFSFTTAAGDLIVDSTADGVDTNPGDGLCLTVAGTCTLRAAVQEANATPGNERREIVLPAGLYTLTRTGSGEDAAATGDLDITGNVTILGMEGTRETERAFPSSLSSSSSLSVTIDASTMNDRVFHVLAGGRLSLSLVAVSGGRADNGGGVYNSGTLTVTQSTLSGNTSTATLLAGGGAVYNSGQLVVRSSTLSSNVSGDRGGGLYNTGSSPTATIENSTISGNSAGHAGAIFGDTGSITVYDSTVTENLASRDGGGLYELNASMTLRNTVWAGNVALSHGDDCWGGMSSAGYNLLGTNEYCAFASSIGDDVGTPGNEIDPLLGPLQNNGGPTWTHALLPYSWAIDRGHPGYCPTTDQRGVARPQGAGCDKGAFELEALPLTCRSPGLAIPDNDPAGASDDLLLTDSGAITDLNVSLQVAHTWVGDLVFTLTHVDTGTSVTIIDRPGLPPPPSCNGDDIDATLDDEAADPVENACAPTTPTILGVFVPNGSLAGFDGEDLAGTWRLTAADLAQSDVGALTQWCVIATR